jgi:hypothetical protein
MEEFSYISDRYTKQLEYFERKAAQNQALYLKTRRLMMIASWLTPIAIFVQFMLPLGWRDLWSIVSMVLSTVAIGCYQWEEQHNYGAQWSKFRLVAENLKHQLVYFQHKAGPFRNVLEEEARRLFVEVVEKIIEGTDINYFTLMVDPAAKSENTIC